MAVQLLFPCMLLSGFVQNRSKNSWVDSSFFSSRFISVNVVNNIDTATA